MMPNVATDDGSTNVNVSPATRETANANTHASYVPHDLKYSAEFEDILMDTVLNTMELGQRVKDIPLFTQGGNEKTKSGVEIPSEGSNIENLPNIQEDELPLAPSDARRVYMSPIPGVKLTHPGGYLEGGPGLDPEMDTFPDDFFSTHASSITSPEGLREAIEKEIQAGIQQLQARMQARRQGKEKNEQIERDIKVLTDQHSMELRIQNRMAEERRKKREAKEKDKGFGDSD